MGKCIHQCKYEEHVQDIVVTSSRHHHGIVQRKIKINHDREIPGVITAWVLWRTTGGVRREGIVLGMGLLDFATDAQGALDDGEDGVDTLKLVSGCPATGVSSGEVGGSGTEAAESGMKGDCFNAPGPCSLSALCLVDAVSPSGGGKSQGRGTSAAGIIHVEAQTTPFPLSCLLIMLNSKSMNCEI